MSSKRYPEEFKIEAVRQVTDRGRSVAQVEGRAGRYDSQSLRVVEEIWTAGQRKSRAKTEDQAEIRRLQKELKRVTEERDI